MTIEEIRELVNKANELIEMADDINYEEVEEGSKLNTLLEDIANVANDIYYDFDDVDGTVEDYTVC